MKKIILIFLFLIFSPNVFAVYAIETAWNTCQSGLTQNQINLGYSCRNYPTILSIGKGITTDPNSSIANFSYGINGGCPSGATFNETTGVCVLPPTCTAGQTAPVMKMIASSSTGELNIFIGGFANSTETVCSGGCTYSFNNESDRTGNQGSSSDGLTSFTEYNGTTTGATCTGSEPTASGTPTNKPSPGCVGDSTGKIICINNNVDKKCGTVNGTEICPGDSNNPECVQIPGFNNPVCSGAPKNCGWVNGQYFCAEPDSGPARNSANQKTCLNSDSSKDCLTGKEGVETTKTSESVTDGDTTTTTTTVDNNVIGDNPSTTTTVVNNAAGTSTTTGQGTDDGKGDSKALSEIAKNTGETKGLLDKIFDAMSPGTATGDIGTDQTGIDATIQGDIDSLTSRKTDESSFLALDLFDVPSTSTCTGVNETKLGLTLDFDPCEKLQPLREMLGWLLYVLLVQFAYSMATRGNAR